MTYVIPPDIIPDSSLIDVVLPEESGYSEACAAGDDHDSMWDAAGDAAREFPSHLWIEPREWPAVAAENDRLRTWPENYRGRFTNQKPSHECTAHALVQVAETRWNKQRAGLFSMVFLSPLSVYGEANQRQWGGANGRTVLGIAVRRGILPDKIQPRDYGFAHSLHGTTGQGNATQSSGPLVRLSQFPDGWQETAKHFKPLEIIFPTSWEQIVCLVLHGYAVGAGRNGHMIPYMQWLHSRSLMAYADSYDVIRYDSISNIKRAVGSSYAIASFTIPDDWQKPGG